jgi:hypothetical protein
MVSGRKRDKWGKCDWKRKQEERGTIKGKGILCGKY